MKSRDILKKLLPVAEETISRINENNIQSHQNWLKSYEKILKTMLENLRQKANEQDTLSGLWSELDNYTEKFFQLNDSINFMLKDFTEEKLWADWEQRFNQFMSEYTEKIQLPIPEDFLIPGNEDSTFIRMGKWYRRILMRIKNFGIQSTNKIRVTLHQPPVQQVLPVRTFQLHNFLMLYLDIPLSLFFLQEKQLFLNMIATHLFQLHEISERVKDDFIVLDNSENVYHNKGAVQLISNTRYLNETLKLIEKFIGETDGFEEKTRERFSETFAGITKKFQRNWELAGTFALPDRQFSGDKTSGKKNEFRKQYDRIKSAWNNHFEGEKKEWQKDLELSAFQLQSALLCVNTMQIIHSKVNSNILPALHGIHESVTDSLEKFTGLDSNEKTELKRAILKENHVLLRQLRQEKLPHIMDTVTQASIEQAYRGYFNQIQNELKAVSDEHVLFEHRDLDHTPPQSKTDRVSLKELIQEEIISPLDTTHQEFAERTHQHIQMALRAISEIDQIVEINLEAALNLIKENQKTSTIDNAHQIVVEGLQRTQIKINELIEIFQQIVDQTRTNLLETALELNKKVQELSVNEKVFELKIRFTRAKTRKELRSILKNTVKKIVRSIRLLTAFSIRLFRKTRGLYNRFRKVTGLTAPPSHFDVKLANYLTETRQKVTQLPYVYQRLFRLEPLSDSRFFVRPDNEMLIFQNDFSQWVAGKHIAVAVVGERGSGKTTLLNFVESEIFKGFPIIKIVLDNIIYQEADLLTLITSNLHISEVQTFDELEEMLINQETRKICIVENLHRLFLRTVEGFDAIERFLLFVSKTQTNIYWIATCALYGWQYLEKVLQISKYFNRTLILGSQTIDEMKDIILKRHRASGYSFQFEIPDEFKRSRKFKKLPSDEERRSYLAHQLFEQLADLSAGNIRVAMLFWLMGIKEITKETFVLSPKIEFDYTFVYQLPAEELFALASLIQHEIINAHQHALIFHQDLNESLSILNRLLNRGFLQKNDVGYSIHPFLYRPVVKALKSKNILQ